MRRKIALLAAVSAACLGALAPTGAQALVVGHVRIAIDSNPSFSSYTWTADHEQVVILQPWDISQLYALKAANPSVKVLMYKNASSVSTSVAGDGRYATGVSYNQAVANGWLLHNTSGSPFQFQGYSWLYAADIGAAAYQQAWASNVLSELTSDPWDGVFIDDVNPTIRYHYCVTCVAKYPSDAQYGSAMGSFVQNVGPQIQAAGKLAVANIGSWSGYSTVADGWLRSLSGAMDENFLKWGTQHGSGYADPATWGIQLHEVELAASEGKLFIGVTHSSNDDGRAAVYGYATELLAGDGAGDTVFSMTGDYSGEPWFPAYNIALGAPRGAQWTLGNGVHERQFMHGLVLVNPTMTSETVVLRGHFTGSGLHDVATATLSPQSGLVLHRAHPLTAHVDASRRRGAQGWSAGHLRHGRRHHHRRHHRRHSRRHRHHRGHRTRRA